MAAEDGHLFPLPPAQPGRATELYDARRKTGKGYNYSENVRVRKLFISHVNARAKASHVADDDHARSLERGSFVNDLVALCEREGVAYYRGAKATHARGDDAAKDSIRTQLRNFWTGTNMPDYMLVAVEATICDRTGHSLPGPWYSLQRRMNL